MNYNNFICRLSVPRLSVITSPPPAIKTEPKKARKSARRRLATVATTVCLMLGCGVSALQAKETGQHADKLRLTPASGTVPFTGISPAAFSNNDPSSVFDEPTLAARMNELGAQVNALTTQAWQQVAPPNPARLSVLTGALLVAGGSVALFRARLLLRPSLVC